MGASGEDSSHTGAFAPTDTDYQAALDSDVVQLDSDGDCDPRIQVNNSCSSGAVTVYRRPEGGAWAVEAFVKAPAAGAGDFFGFALALSADGSALAVGASREDSSHTGAFAPADDGYQAALDSNGQLDSRGFCDFFAEINSCNSGAVTVYRRSNEGRWAVEAFVKAPAAGAGDFFGDALALSADGSALAVGAPFDDSASTGAFAPGGEGYQTALDSDGAGNSGAAYVYRRSNEGRWAVEAFVKAPATGVGDFFGDALALFADGSALAVGAPFEDSAASGVFAPGDPGYQAALDSDGRLDSGGFCDFFAEINSCGSGAVTVYRRSNEGRWAVEAFVKAPAAGAFDFFGGTLALSADGSALAVGARGEDSSHTGAFAPADTDYQAALDSNGQLDSRGFCDFFAEINSCNSGAVTVYRRSNEGRWAVEAFVKAPAGGVRDNFGSALALSADGSALAAGASGEDGPGLERPVGGASADIEDPVPGSGAAYLY